MLEMLLLLYAYKELFEHNPSAPPPIDGIEYAFYFRTDDPIPVRMRIPRLSPAQLEHMGKDTKTMLKNTIIQFSDSEWATRPVFARKKDGTWRYAIDYRKLNDRILQHGFLALIRVWFPWARAARACSRPHDLREHSLKRRCS